MSGSVSDLGRQLVEQRLVDVAVDLAADQLFGTGHGEHGRLATQVFLGAVGGGLDLGDGERLLATGFDDGLDLGLFDDLVRPDAAPGR